MEELKTKVEELKTKLTGDMFKDFEIRDQIHQLEMKINGTVPSSQDIECVGCGA